MPPSDSDGVQEMVIWVASMSEISGLPGALGVAADKRKMNRCTHCDIECTNPFSQIKNVYENQDKLCKFLYMN